MKKSITTPERKIVLIKIISIVLLFVLFTNCDKENDKENDSDDPPQSKDGSVTMMTNATDPMIMAIKKDKGTMEYYGDRNEIGLPVNIKEVKFTDNNKQETRGFFDADNKPVAFVAPNGVQFFIEWRNDTDFNLLAVSPDGETQINTTGSLKSTAKGPSVTTGKVYKPREGKLKLTPFAADSFKKKNLSSAVGNNFTIDKCGPFDVSSNMVWVDLKDGNGKFVRRLDLTKIETGKFRFNVPSNSIPSVNLKDMIEGTQNLIDGICEAGGTVPGSIATFGTAMCSSLSLAMASTGIGAVLAAPFFSACEYSVLLLESHCDFKDLLQLMPDEYIDAFDITVYETPNIILNGVVVGIPENIKTMDYVAPAQGPYPDINMVLENKPSIKSFILSPSAPVAGDDYNAVVDISCLNAGTVIKISIIGSDGYTDQISYTVSASQTSDSFILTVPGADVGVNDECTVEVTTLGNIIATRKAYLVFK